MNEHGATITIILTLSCGLWAYPFYFISLNAALLHRSWWIPSWREADSKCGCSSWDSRSEFACTLIT